MMDPRRLLSEGATDAERALLDSAGSDGPPEGAAERTLLALQGLGAQASPDPGQVAQAGARAGSTAGASVKLAGIGGVAKVVLVGLVGLGLLGAGVLVIRGIGRQVAQVPERPAAVVPPATLAGPPARPPAVEPLAGVEARQPEAASEPTSASKLGGSHGRGAGAEASLAAEIRVLDGARLALDAHDPASAGRSLGAYAQRFPHGHLEPEAAVLRLAVLVQQGKRAEAKAFAAHLLSGSAYQAYESRIRSLLREAGQAPFDRPPLAAPR